MLTVAAGLRVPLVAALVDRLRDWRPESITCDRFRLPELLDAGLRVPILPRVSRWSESAEDIRALRRQALDGDLAVAPEARGLLTASLSAARVANDDAGNVRMVKRGANNQARDDVAAALVLAAGAAARRPAPRKVRLHVA